MYIYTPWNPDVSHMPHAAADGRLRPHAVGSEPLPGFFSPDHHSRTELRIKRLKAALSPSLRSAGGCFLGLGLNQLACCASEVGVSNWMYDGWMSDSSLRRPLELQTMAETKHDSFNANSEGSSGRLLLLARVSV